MYKTALLIREDVQQRLLPRKLSSMLRRMVGWLHNIRLIGVHVYFDMNVNVVCVVVVPNPIDLAMRFLSGMYLGFF